MVSEGGDVCAPCHGPRLGGMTYHEQKLPYVPNEGVNTTRLSLAGQGTNTPTLPSAARGGEQDRQYCV